MSGGRIARALRRRRARTAGADTGEVRRLRRSGMDPLRAGLLSVVLIAIACYAAFGGRAPWAHDYTVKAVVSNAVELDQRSPVRIAGVDVGHVAAVTRGPGSAATVTMALKRSALPLHRDATLKIRPRLFLEGNFFIDLQPGTPAAPKLPEGGTIPISQTAVAVQLDQVLSSLRASPRAELKQLVHGFATSLENGGARAWHDTIPLLEPAFLYSAITAQALQGERPDDLRAAIRDAGRVSAAIDSRSAELPGLVSDLDTTLTALAARGSELAATVAGVNDVVGRAPPTLAALNRLFPTARVFAAELRPALVAAPQTLALANPFLDQAARLTSPTELPALLGELRPALRSLRTLEPGLGSVLSSLRPVTECLRTDVVPTIRKPVSDPPLTTGEPVYLEFLDSVVGLASSSQNFDGNGPALRYHVGFGDQVISTGSFPGASQGAAGLTPYPILGSRPRYTGVTPPFRPDVPCITQRQPDLTAETGPAPSQRQLP